MIALPLQILVIAKYETFPYEEHCVLVCEAVRNGYSLETFMRGLQLSTSVLTMEKEVSLEISATSYRTHVVTTQKTAMFFVAAWRT